MTYSAQFHLRIRESADPDFLSAYSKMPKFTSEDLERVLLQFQKKVPKLYSDASFFRHHKDLSIGPKEYIQLKPTRDSLAKKVIQYAKAYYTFIGDIRCAQSELESHENEQVRCASMERFFDFLDRIEGIDVSERSQVMHVGSRGQDLYINTSKDRGLIECQDFVFGNEPWFSPAMKKILVSEKGKALLLRQGYEAIGKPVVGSLIVYFVNKKPAHFGIVVEVKDSGDVIVDSKFSSSHVFHHKAELVDPLYGEDVEYFLKK